MSTLGPLTTVFTPSSTCASYAGYTEFVNQSGGSYLVRGPVTTEGCFPSGFKLQTDYYYTPGQCPSGYTQGCAFKLDRGTVAVVSAYCCPEVESAIFACQMGGNSRNPLPTSFPCTQIISNTTSLLPITRVSDGSTLTTITSTITAATIGAYGVQIQYSDDDKLEQPPDPERFNKVRLAYGTQTADYHHGLSPEAKVGLGVGTCFAAGLIALGVVIFLKRKRETQGVAACKHTAVATSSTPSSTLQIRRKPVPSVHSSDLSAGAASGEEGYRALGASEFQNDTGRGAGQSRGQRQKVFGGISLWAWEILSLFTSVLSLASIIIVLDVYENRRSDEWRPIISINAVISILSAIFKGSLALPVTEGISQLKWLMFAKQPRALSELDVYDKASRGAWGSTMMIFGQFKSESRAYLASFGALLILIILAADPFAQATISLYNCAQNGTDIASIPRANNYTVGKDLYNPVMADTFNVPMQLAAFRGILEPPANSSASVSVSCTTGNCTFPQDGGVTFTSLTMCSNTWDVSDRIETKDTDNGYMYSLGAGNSIGAGSKFNMSFTTVPTTSFRASEEDAWNRTSVVDVYILGMIKDNSTDCKPPLCTLLSDYSAYFRPSAFVFSLFPCVQTFSATLSRGQYSEKVLSEDYLHYASAQAAGKYQLFMDRTMINGTWHQCTSTAKPNENNTIPVLLKPDDGSLNPPHTWYSPECVFEFYGAFAMGTFLGETFFIPSRWPGQPAAWESKLWRNGSTDIELVTKFATGLATSIGAQMRVGAVGPDMLREARGITLVEKTCIRIHWGYIAFFAVVFVLEVLFLGTVMVLSYRSKLHADWKSSTLAVAFLSSGSPRRSGWSAENPESEDSLRDAARSVKASLTDDTGTWQLRTQGPKF